MRAKQLRAMTYLAVAVGTAMAAAPIDGQTIDGVLMEVQSDRPISLGLVIMMTEGGDSVTSAVTDSNGRFRVASPAPGTFSLIASAFGFKETRVGMFELGPDGSMNIEFRVGAEAMPIDGILVELQRPAIQHQLVRNGYVRRLQRGLGEFITPYDIEQSVARTSSDLFRGIPGVAVQGVAGGGVNSYQGDVVRFFSANGYCTPTVYLDGLRLSPAITSNQPLDVLVPLQSIDAAEIYRRPSEVPIEYGATGIQPSSEYGGCGVLVLWTKTR